MNKTVKMKNLFVRAGFILFFTMFAFSCDWNSESDYVKLVKSDDEKILDSIIREAVYENYIDLSKYYQYDQLGLDIS